MLRRAMIRVALFSQTSQTKLVKVNIYMDGSIKTYHFAEGSFLAANLQKQKIPLEFECGYGCRCGTCPLKLSQSDYKLLQAEQPVKTGEQLIIRTNSYDNLTRLSCQLKVQPLFQSLTFIIDY